MQEPRNAKKLGREKTMGRDIPPLIGIGFDYLLKLRFNNHDRRVNVVDVDSALVHHSSSTSDSWSRIVIYLPDVKTS